jgi:hypothetical protein
LKPWERKTVNIPLSAKSLACWYPGKHAWTIENENLRPAAGTSSADLRLNKIMAVK